MASTDRATLDRLLDTVHIGHFAIVGDDGHPVVLPTAVVRDGDRVLAHGSTGSRWLRRLAAGAPTCLAVTAFDALVVARSAFESSMRYRSAVVFGQCRAITEPDAKRTALDTITDALIPGRTVEVRASTRKELAAVLVVELPIEEWSLKVSEGWPEDPPDDVDGPAWAGVLPVVQSYDRPLAAPDLRDGIPLPDSVQRLLNS
jgi:nitroimidazol reductase NimA-like FMN-containing flavoprotein (pyridoxamine 5'-phosphate oxidase superfamily)